MKQTLFYLIIFAISGHQTAAQWNTFSANFGRTNLGIQSIAVGTFANTSDFQARLHVNNFYCNQPASVSLNGRLFRTDGDQSVVNSWQLFTGSSALNQTERFRIAVQPNGFDTYLTRNQVGSEAEIRLLTAEIQLWCRNKRYASFCDISTGSDEIIFGDGTDVNTTIRTGNGGRLFVRGFDGFTGLGHEFGETGQQPNYLLHLLDSVMGGTVFQQFTTRGTGYNPSDGLRIGINSSGSAEINMFEDFPLEFLQRNRLRMRISSANWTGLNGVSVNNAGRNFLTLDGTFMSGTNGGAWSLLHLGLRNQSTANRNWMNIGISMTNRFTVGLQELGDYMYVGLMERPLSNVPESVDAVVAWGCNDSLNIVNHGPDNLRFIFTTASNGSGTAATNQGREVMRITPEGRIGMGDWSGNVPGNGFGQGGYIGATLDVNGDARIRGLTQDNNLNRVLVVDPTDRNRLHWRTTQGLDCNWQNEQYGIGTGYVGPCNTQNVGIGLVPDEKVKLKVKTTNPAQTEALWVQNLNIGGNGGYFQGAQWSVISNGSSLASGGTWQVSDQQLKTDVLEFTDALSIIGQLKPRTYHFIQDQFTNYLQLPNEMQYGLLAQEVEAVLPSLVRQTTINNNNPEAVIANQEAGIMDVLEVKAVNYDQLIPILIQAVKEQQTQISSLQMQLGQCCSQTSQRSVEFLNDTTLFFREENVVLDQNVPNPFQEMTQIQAVLPQIQQSAYLYFYDSSGKLIHTVQLKQCDRCIVNVFAGDFAMGMYTYALVIDGKIIEAKRMIRN